MYDDELSATPQDTEPISQALSSTRRSFLTLEAATAGALTTGSLASAQTDKCIDIPERPTARRPDPQPNQRVYSDKETVLAFRPVT